MRRIRRLAKYSVGTIAVVGLLVTIPVMIWLFVHVNDAEDDEEDGG